MTTQRQIGGIRRKNDQRPAGRPGWLKLTLMMAWVEYRKHIAKPDRLKFAKLVVTDLTDRDWDKLREWMNGDRNAVELTGGTVQ